MIKNSFSAMEETLCYNELLGIAIGDDALTLLDQLGRISMASRLIDIEGRHMQ
jgi:hypothetical protein